tara:strand:+ start:47625 stop:47849 length:225 start_codon:yes stop_codon:yes gene_type:complete
MPRAEELRALGEQTGALRVCGEKVAYRFGDESGEVFASDEDFDGYTLTIEITSAAQFAAILRALAAEQEGQSDG